MGSSNALTKPKGAFGKCNTASTKIKSEAKGAANDPGWREPGFKTGFAVSGGFLKKPLMVDCVSFEDTQYLKFSKGEPWHCLVTTGNAVGLCPFGRTMFCARVSQLLADPVPR